MNETTEVALVFMPYGRADRPVIGLGYLAAALQQAVQWPYRPYDLFG